MSLTVMSFRQPLISFCALSTWTMKPDSPFSLNSVQVNPVLFQLPVVSLLWASKVISAEPSLPLTASMRLSDDVASAKVRKTSTLTEISVV